MWLAQGSGKAAAKKWLVLSAALDQQEEREATMCSCTSEDLLLLMVGSHGWIIAKSPFTSHETDTEAALTPPTLLRAAEDEAQGGPD